jgi:hypothetical protein
MNRTHRSALVNIESDEHLMRPLLDKDLRPASIKYLSLYYILPSQVSTQRSEIDKYTMLMLTGQQHRLPASHCLYTPRSPSLEHT